MATYAPATILVKLILEPHQDNRVMCWGYESQTDFRRSCEELEGIKAPKNYWFTYKNVPKGSYEAFVELFRAPKAALAGSYTAKFRVFPEIGDPND